MLAPKHNKEFPCGLWEYQTKSAEVSLGCCDPIQITSYFSWVGRLYLTYVVFLYLYVPASCHTMKHMSHDLGIRFCFLFLVLFLFGPSYLFAESSCHFQWIVSNVRQPLNFGLLVNWSLFSLVFTGNVCAIGCTGWIWLGIIFKFESLSRDWYTMKIAKKLNRSTHAH